MSDGNHWTVSLIINIESIGLRAPLKSNVSISQIYRNHNTQDFNSLQLHCIITPLAVETANKVEICQ